MNALASLEKIIPETRPMVCASGRFFGTGVNAEPGQKRNQWGTFLEALTAANVFFPVAIVCLSVAGFAFGHRIHGWYLPLAGFITICGLRLFTASWRLISGVAGITVLLLMLAFLLARHFYDSSWDGLAYHQNAVLCLSKGWNPFFESSAAYGGVNEGFWTDSLWDDHYPKGSWIVGAAIFMGCGQIESGKLLNLTLMVAAAAQLAAVLLRLTSLRGWQVTLLAALAALNPVAIYQSTAFYVDGLMASAVTIMVSALVLYVVRPRGLTLGIVIAAMCLAINLKFTGLVYSVVLTGAAALIISWRQGMRSGWRLAIITLLAGLFATLVLGYAPYVRNICDKGNMLYPVFGAAPGEFHQADYIPVNIAKQNRITAFLVSNFSRSERVHPPNSTTPKFPFLVYHAGEGATFLYPDTEAAGFGPFYGGLLVLSVLGLGLLAVDRAAWKPLAVAATIGGVLLASMFTHDQAWWARYVPQGWLLPLIVATTCLVTAQRFKRRWLGWTIIGFMSVNVLFVGFYFMRGEWRYCNLTHAMLGEMSASTRPITVYVGPFASLSERLREAGVQFQTVPTAPNSEQGADVWQSIPCPSTKACWTTGSLRTVGILFQP